MFGATSIATLVKMGQAALLVIQLTSIENRAFKMMEPPDANLFQGTLRTGLTILSLECAAQVVSNVF